MPESKEDARARAKRLGIPLSNVVEAEDGGYFIAPQGLTTKAAKEAYAECRADGGSKEKCARIAWTVEEKAK